MTVLAELSNLCAAFLVHTRGEHTKLTVRVRVQLIRHFKTCKTDIYLQNKCAHVGLSVHAPVQLWAECGLGGGPHERVKAASALQRRRCGQRARACVCICLRDLIPCVGPGHTSPATLQRAPDADASGSGHKVIIVSPRNSCVPRQWFS